MIHIEQDQQLKDDSKIRAAVPTGDYNETDLIECYVEGADPNIPTCMYQAQYVVFGGPIYGQTEELTEDQVAALLANVPHDEVINNRKLMDGKKPAAKFVGRVIKRRGGPGKRELRKDQVDVPVEQKVVVPQQVTPTENVIDTNTATSTPQSTFSTTTPATNVDTSVSTSTSPFSTTTPAFDIPNDTATSTNATTTLDVPDLDTDTSSTTPDVIVDPVVSSSTQDVIDTASSTVPVINTDASTTTPEILNDGVQALSSKNPVIAFAKKQIGRKLGL
ncbi:MAG: hypothetical protein PHG25_01360 [Candidatus Pacebacteria bacterium]|nr:hypothetical protein [Candidatus Paceibacterota bacterium]